MIESRMFHTITDNINGIVPIKIAVKQFVIAGQEITDSHHIELVKILFGNFVAGISDKFKTVLNT